MRFAKRMERLKDKELVELMDLAEIPDVLSFAGGFPSPETYPIEDIKQSMIEVLDHQGEEALSYSSVAGYLPLRQQISDRMNALYHMSLTADDIMITSGSQPAMDMSGMMFLDEQDVILFEAPSYLGALNAFKAYNPNLITIPTDKDGIILEDLKAILEKEGERIKLIYVIPDFQNPTCRRWSEERRQGFMELIVNYDIAVIEDGAYSELDFDGVKSKPLISYDKKGQVAYCGTFSKTFCPGLRVGWVCASKLLMDNFMQLKANIDLSSSTIAQRQMAWYLEHYDYDNHLIKIKKLYETRKNYALKMAEQYFPKGVTFERPNGGLFLWVTLPPNKDATVLLNLCLKEKVAFVPGRAFYPKGEKNNELRINFSNMKEDEIERGFEIIGKHMMTYINE